MLNYYNYYNNVFCLGVKPALCAHKGTATYYNMQTHTQYTIYSDVTNYSDD